MPSHPGNSWVSVMAGAAGAARHLYLVLLLPLHVPSLFIEQVCPAVRPCLSEVDRLSRKGWPLRLEMKEPLHFAIYALLPHSRLPSPHNVLHSPSIYVCAHVQTAPAIAHEGFLTNYGYISCNVHGIRPYVGSS